MKNKKDLIDREIKNQVQLIGNLGQTPTLSKTSTGKSWVRFSLATNDEYQNNYERKKICYWHNVVAWGEMAEYISDTCTKGKEIVVIGKLTNRVYETKEGDKKYITEVVASDIICANTNKEENKEEN